MFHYKVAVDNSKLYEFTETSDESAIDRCKRRYSIFTIYKYKQTPKGYSYDVIFSQEGWWSWLKNLFYR